MRCERDFQPSLVAGCRRLVDQRTETVRQDGIYKCEDRYEQEGGHERRVLRPMQLCDITNVNETACFGR